MGTRAGRWLVVVKQSAFELYNARLARGEVFSDVRWDRLRERHDAHVSAVRSVQRALRGLGVPFAAVRRDRLTAEHAANASLVVTVGGDGTGLLTSHLLGGGTPLLCVNSDPTPFDAASTKEQELATLYKSAEPFDIRRSTGHLCCCSGADHERYLERVLAGEAPLEERSRIATRINGQDGVLPPALNDVLAAHPSPAAVSRYSVQVRPEGEGEEALYLHVRSSGLRVCTATGSTAAMISAGGEYMSPDSKEMQYMDREPIYHDHRKPPGCGHGFLGAGEVMRLRWGSRVGALYVDGAHAVHPIALGDIVEFSTAGPPLKLYGRG